jgi:hypothetical protein
MRLTNCPSMSAKTQSTIVELQQCIEIQSLECLPFWRFTATCTSYSLADDLEGRHTNIHDANVFIKVETPFIYINAAL